MESRHHLAAIMFTDIAGFTQLSAEDEEKALNLLRTQRRVLQPIVSEFHGKWLKEIGDGLLLSFPSSKLAVQCGIRMQQATKVHVGLNLRIGIHQGDVYESDGDVLGDDVNIASRIEPFSAIGGIAISHKVQGDISGSPEFTTAFVGKPALKGVRQKIEVYCITSHGLPPTRRSDVSAKLEQRHSRWLVWAVPLVLLVAAVYYFGAYQTHADQIESIAVLPFDNLSGDPEEEYFSDGMTVALSRELSSYGKLNVISRQSVMQFKDSQLALPEIAEKLGVDAIVEGTVLRENNVVSINVGLVNARLDKSIWQDDFDREITNILSLYRELAQTIARQIDINLLPDEASQLTVTSEVDPAAYEAYLKGRAHWFRLTPQDMKIAAEYFKFAIEQDQDYAAAYVGYADAIATPAHMGFVPSSRVYPTAREYILRALEIDPNLAEGHDLLARLRFAYDWSPVSAEKGFKRAIELKPSYPDARWVYSQLLSLTGRLEDAELQVQKARELDPFNPVYQLAMAILEAISANYDDAISGLRQILSEHPNYVPAHHALSGISFRLGDFDQALIHCRKWHELIGDTAIVTIMDVGDSYQSIMQEIGDLLVEQSESQYVSPVRIAYFYALAGQNKQAMDWLEKAIDVRDTSIIYIKIQPAFYRLYDENRFKQVLQRINLLDTRDAIG